MEKRPAFRNWWLLSVKGLTLLILGIFLLFRYTNELNTTSKFFGIFLLLSGIFIGIFALSNIKMVPFWYYLIEGLSEIALGFILIVIHSQIIPAEFSGRNRGSTGACCPRPEY